MSNETCSHKFSRFSIAMLGIRWQCVKCDLIAPACFEPDPAFVTVAQRDYDVALDDLLAPFC